MDSVIADFSVRPQANRLLPSIDGRQDPLFSALLDESAERTPAEADEVHEDEVHEDEEPDGRDESDRPDADASAQATPEVPSGKHGKGRMTAADEAVAVPGDADAVADATRPITVEAAQVRFATAEDALPVPATAEQTIAKAVEAAATGRGQNAGAGETAHQAGEARRQASHPLKAAEDFVLGRRAHLLEVNAAHAELARSQAGKAGKEARIAGKAAAEGGTKATSADGSAAAARAGDRTPASVVPDRPAAAPVSAAPATGPAASAGPIAGLQAPLSATPQFADTLKTTAGGDTLTLDQAGSTAGERQAMQASAAKSAANARPAPNMPLPRPAEQLSVQIRNAAANGNERISVRLSPASLGQVEVTLELAPDKTVHAVVMAEKPETLDMLERDARVLQRALEDAGLKTGSDSLTFERRDTGGQPGRADGDRGDGTPGETGNTTQDDAVLAEAQVQTRRHHDGLVDVEI